MPQFRRRPVVVEAMQFKDLKSFLPIVNWMRKCGDPSALRGTIRCMATLMKFRTAQGDVVTARLGDWVVRGVKGEFYPCEEAIFAETFDPVDEEPVACPPKSKT